MLCSVKETWNHVIEMLRRYWLEVFFVFFTIFRCWLLLVVSSFFRLFGHFVDYGINKLAKNKKNKFWNSSSSLSSAMFLVRETWMNEWMNVFILTSDKPQMKLQRITDGSVCNLYTNFLCQFYRTSFSYKKLGPSAISLTPNFDAVVAQRSALATHMRWMFRPKRRNFVLHCRPSPASSF